MPSSVPSYIQDWNLTLKHFETVHGVRRVTFLMEDKFETALSVCENNKDNPEEDGTFLVDQVIQLLQFYLELQKNIDEKCAIDSFIPNSFYATIKLMIEECQAMKFALKRRKISEARDWSWTIVHSFQNINTCATIFLHLVHPAIIEISKLPNLSEEAIEEIIKYKTAAVQETQQLLSNDFSPVMVTSELKN